jgi:spore coat protein H
MRRHTPLQVAFMLCAASTPLAAQAGDTLPLAWRFTGAGSAWRAVQPWNPALAPPRLHYTGEALRLALVPTQTPPLVTGAIYVELPRALGSIAEIVVEARGIGGLLRVGPRYNLRPGSGTEADVRTRFIAGSTIVWLPGDSTVRTLRIRVDDAPQEVREFGISFDSRTAARVEVISIALLPALPIPASAVVRRLTARPRDGRITLTWKAAAGATAYAVYASDVRHGADRGAHGASRVVTRDTSWVDAAAAPGRPRFYAVAPLHAGGEGELSGEVIGEAVLAVAPVTLRLSMPRDSLEALYGRVSWIDDWVPVRVNAEPAGVTIDGAGVRLAGSSTRMYAKKSLHVRLPERAAFNFGGATRRGGDHIVLNSMWTDPSALREHLSLAMYRAIGRPAPATYPVDVYLNDVFEGHYLSVERVDREALRGWGLPAGRGTTLVRDETKVLRAGTGITRRSIFGVNIDSLRHTDAERIVLLKQLFDYRGDEDDPDWPALLELVRWAWHAVPGAALEAEYRRRFDMEMLLDMLALHVLAGDWDSLDIDYWLHRSTEGDGRWRLIPWDKDLNFGKQWSNGGDNDLLSYDFYINPIGNRLIELLLETPPLLQALHARVDSLSASVFTLDWYRQRMAEYRPMVIDGVQRTRGPGAYAMQPRQHAGETGYDPHHAELLLDLTERRYRYVERAHRPGGVSAYADRVAVQDVAAGTPVWLTGTDGFTFARVVPLEPVHGRWTLSGEVVDADTLTGVRKEYRLHSSVPVRAEVTLYYRHEVDHMWLTGADPDIAREWTLDMYEAAGGGADRRLRSRVNPFMDGVVAVARLGGARAFRLLYGP